MEPYLIIYTLTALLVPTDRIKLTSGARIACMSVPFFLLLLLTGTRVSTGNDWIPYFDYFATLSLLNDKSEDFEVGYRLFAYLSKSSGLNYQGFVLLSSFVYLAIFFLVFRKQVAPIALILLFYCTFLLGWMGTARQVIAISLTVLAGQFLIDGYKFRFFLVVISAGFFHLTALIFVIAWYILRPIPKLSTIIVIIAICVVAGQLSRFILPMLLDTFSGVPGLGKKFLFYANLGSEDLKHAYSGVLAILWYVKRLAFLGFFLLLRRHFNSKSLAFYFNAYLVSVAIFLIINPTFPILATRGSNYFAIYELFLLASIILMRIKFSAIFILLLALISGQRLYTSLYAYHPEVYIPYKGIFINESVRREGY